MDQNGFRTFDSNHDYFLNEVFIIKVTVKDYSLDKLIQC